jgi:hypothetical protein
LTDDGRPPTAGFLDELPLTVDRLLIENDLAAVLGQRSSVVFTCLLAWV